MGYSEVLCHICGVSFNIGRIRRPGEPRTARFNQYSKDHYVDGFQAWSECGPDAGCMFTFPAAWTEGREIIVDADGKRCLGEVRDDGQRVAEACSDLGKSSPALMTGSGDEHDLNDGPDTDESLESLSDDASSDGHPDGLEYAGLCSLTTGNSEYGPPDESDADEPLEYFSDDGMEGVEAGDPEDEGMEIDQYQPTHEERTEFRRLWQKAIIYTSEGQKQLCSDNNRYMAWYRGRPSYFAAQQEEILRNAKDDVFPLFGQKASIHHSLDLRGAKPTEVLAGGLNYHKKDRRKVEHIAGPGCGSSAGYNGHKITAEEMRGCYTSQCLVRKPPGWSFHPQADDEPFELDGQFFLSGLNDHMPSRDMSCPRVRPIRHGCESPHAENCLWTEDAAYEYAMPFHPSCLEVWKRASQRHQGHIDIGGLTGWWSLEADYHFFHDFPRAASEALSVCHGQWWAHCPGTEFLVANPLHIPPLPAILEQASSTDPNFTTHDGAFHLTDQSMQISDAHDPFADLPLELRLQVISSLTSKDIANLRLASQSFRQLPVSFFQTLINKEMPWLWEAWPTPQQPQQMPYAYWATVADASHASVPGQELEDALAGLRDYLRIVKEDLPEIYPQVEKAGQQYQQHVEEQCYATRTKTAAPFSLPPDRTNYYALYTLITRHWAQLKGLQNRRRIWADCQEILRRVDGYRAEGRLDAGGITEDLRQILSDSTQRQIRRNQEANAARSRQLSEQGTG